MLAREVAEQFDVPGHPVNLQPLGTGNVNDTYQVDYQTPSAEDCSFVLQKINQAVFTDPAAVMSNIVIVTDHARQKIASEAEQADRVWQIPQVIPTRSGQNYLIDAHGDYWRALTMIPNSLCYDQVDTPELANQAGRVLGHFQRIISDCPLDDLQDTLPGFHITPRYLAEYDDIVTSKGAIMRLDAASDARQLAQLIDQSRDSLSVLETALQRGEINLRPIHGDPKISNILMDRSTGKGTCMIDLDTVKPGLIHYDFGDAARSGCNPAGEESLDLNKVRLDIDLFKALAAGYLHEAGQFLTDAENHYLFDSIRLITFELGLRFFTDYLAGDLYFKTRHPEHNLNRAQIQFQLCKSIDRQEATIRTELHSALRLRRRNV